MCLLLFGWRVRDDLPLILAANRDEYRDRPTAPVAFWDDAPSVLAGRDLAARGTWLGVTRTGRVAALTNYREPGSYRRDAPSRGELVAGFLTTSDEPLAYLERAVKRAPLHNGFSLVAGDGDDLYVLSNRDVTPLRRVEPGIHGLSNHLLDTPWPKVRRGKEALAELLARDTFDTEDLLALLRDDARAPDSELPATGVPLDVERELSPLFVALPGYGTRSSAVVLRNASGRIRFVERIHGASPLLSVHEIEVGVRSRANPELEKEVPDVERAP